MPKKKARATEKKDEEDKSDTRIVNLFLILVIGPAIIVSSVATRYYVGGLVGAALIIWGVWETPEVHPTLKLVFNWKNRNKTQRVEVKQSPDAKVLTAGRDVNVFNLPPEKEPVQEPVEEPLEEPEKVYVDTPDHPIIDDTPVLPPKKEISYNLTIRKDETFTIEVNADYPVSVELISMLEWENKLKGVRYSAEKYRDKVKNANIEYLGRRGGDFVLWVYNDSRKQQIGVRVWKET